MNTFSKCTLDTFLSIHPASTRMRKPTTSRTITLRAIQEVWPEGISQGSARIQKMHAPHIPGYPNRRCNPRKPGNTVPAFCRYRLLYSHPRPAEVMSWPSVSCQSQLTNLADAWSGLGAALTWDSQPPASDSSGPANLCPPAEGWTISSSTRNVCACPCVQKHYGQATMCSWNKQKQQLGLDFLSRKFSFFYLLGSCADNSWKVNNAP